MVDCIENQNTFDEASITKKELVVDKRIVVNKLRDLDGELLKKEYKNRWTPDNPTLGYCYIVSEALYHYLDNEVKAYCISMDNGTHWYVTVDGEIVDFTGDQFDFPVDYGKGIGKGFFKGSVKTARGYISKRGYEMALHLGLVKGVL